MNFYDLSKEEYEILNNEHCQEHCVKIDILDDAEKVLSAIEGRITQGSLNISNSSSMRRVCNLTFVAEETDENVADTKNLLSINRRVAVYEGLYNIGLIPRITEKIIWIKQGEFVISQINFSHSLSGLNVNLALQDKMCLLNGTQGGNLPTSITFDSYDQKIGYSEVDILPEYPNTYTVYNYKNKYYKWDGQNWKDSKYSEVGTIESVPQRIYDIIQTLVCRYGNIPIEKIFINDLPLELKQICRFTGAGTLYHNTVDHRYTLNANALKEIQGDNPWEAFEYNEDCGYEYTDFVYPGKLVSAIGDNVCTILDKIKTTLGNFEYFFDINGNFIFQEIKNYLNNSYAPVNTKDPNLVLTSILDEKNYKMDIRSNSKSIYTFTQGTGLITSYGNTPKYENINNDFHVWGKTDDEKAIHYHVAIKRKPTEFHTYQVIYETDDIGNYTGRIRLATQKEKAEVNYIYSDGALITEESNMSASDLGDGTYKLNVHNGAYEEKGILKLQGGVAEVYDYTPTDWRAELYLQGLEKQSLQIRPDIYEQELLDLFDDIYDFRKKEFKADLVTHPNDLLYFFDYIEPIDSLYDYSVDILGPRILSYQQDKIRRIYNTDIPNVIIINIDNDNSKNLINRCSSIGQTFTRVNDSVYKTISLGTIGYTAQEVMRDLIYQHTSLCETISLNTIPIYNLDVNTRITVYDKYTQIYGDYIINSLSIPLGGKGTMSINASRALERL